MPKILSLGTVAAVLALACSSNQARAQYWGFGVGGYTGPFNSGYGIYAPGYSQGLSLGFGVPYYGGYTLPYTYGVYRPYVGGIYGPRYTYPYYGSFGVYRPYGTVGVYRGGFYGRRW